MQSRLMAAGALVAVAVLLTGCAGGGAPPSTEEEDLGSSIEIKLEDEMSEGEPVEGGRLSIMIRLDATDLDPHTATETSAYVINEQVYDSLVHYYRGDIIPGLAETWEFDEDGTTLTFELREDAVFHSGRGVTADDVVYSIQRIQDPATAAPRARSYAGIESIEAIDDYTVVMELAEPSASLLSLLATSSSSIVDREVVEQYGNLNGTVDGGSGPFTLAERIAGQTIKLDAFDGYWEPGVPYLDGMDFTFNPDDNARSAAVRSGTIDFLWRAAPELIETLKADERLNWYGGAGSLSLHLRLNTSRAPFDDVRVRQAIYLALDRQEILDVANAGLGAPLNAGYLPPDRMGALTEPVYGEPDLERARELLAEAGYPDGFDTTLLVISTSAFQVRSAEVEQQQLAAIGINVTLEPAESTIANARMAEDDFDMFQSGFSVTIDPDERFTSSFTDGGGLNYGNWVDEEYEQLIAAARSELDAETRAGLYQQSELILAERGPVAMTYIDANYDVVLNDVRGYRGDGTPTYRFFRNLWLDR